MSPKTTQIVIILAVVGVVAWGLWTMKKQNDTQATKTAPPPATNTAAGTTTTSAATT
jgi:flagellar basal body-associated protein FliL